MRHLRIVLCSLALSVVISTNVAYAAATRPATCSLDTSHTITLSVSKALVRLSSTTSRQALGMRQRELTYSIRKNGATVGTLLLTVRSLPTTSQVVFARLYAPKSALTLTMSLNAAAQSVTVHALHLKADLTYSPWFGVDKTSGPYGWVDIDSASGLDRTAFLSKSYRFKHLVMRYKSGRKSEVDALVAEKTDVFAGVSAGKATVATSLRANHDYCERWMVVSARPVVNSSADISQVAPAVQSDWCWMDPSGTVHKAAYSIEPKTKVGYTHSLYAARAIPTRTAFAATDSPLLENLLLNDLFTLALTRSSDGLWRTDYTSTWVKGESGITAPYVDTRHNEALGMLAPQMAESLSDHGISGLGSVEDWGTSYAAFLIKRASVAGGTTHTPSGFYFADYYDSSGLAKTHSSLNHSLGELVYLMNYYTETSTTAAFQTALGIKRAIDDSGANWLASGNDMHYQRNINGTFTGVESPTLSYYELGQSQNFFTQYLGAPDPTFEMLLDAKKRRLGITSIQRFSTTPAAIVAPLAEGTPSTNDPQP